MGSISRSFRLLKASFAVLSADRELLLFPVFSLIATLLAAGSFIAVAVGVSFAGQGAGQAAMGVLEWVLGFAFYFVTYFITIFFNAAVIGAARIRLDGGDPTVRDGLSIAAAHVGKIAAYAAIAATVGLALRMMSERMGILGKIVIAIIGAAWSAITFFVVPVLIFEPGGPIESIKRSTRLLKERWGEGAVGNGSIGLAMFLLLLPLLLLSFAVAALVSPLVGVGLGVLSVLVVSVLGSTLSGIYLSALYAYATTGRAGTEFGADDLGQAFRPKRR